MSGKFALCDDSIFVQNDRYTKHVALLEIRVVENIDTLHTLLAKLAPHLRFRFFTEMAAGPCEELYVQGLAPVKHSIKEALWQGHIDTITSEKEGQNRCPDKCTVLY